MPTWSVCVCVPLHYTHAGFVCVLEMEWFELTLRLCNNDQLGDEYEKVTTHHTVYSSGLAWPSRLLVAIVVV